MGEYYRTFSEGVAAHTGEQPQSEGDKKGEVEYTEDIVRNGKQDTSPSLTSGDRSRRFSMIPRTNTSVDHWVLG